MLLLYGNGLADIGTPSSLAGLFDILSSKTQMQDVWFDPRQSAQLCEEAPKAYKDLRGVLKAQAELVRVTRRLRPLLVYKAR